MCSLVRIGKMVSARETIGRTNTRERLFSLAFPSSPRARSFSFLKGPMRKREKNALNSNSSVQEFFFLESIIINIFHYQNSELSWKCGFSQEIILDGLQIANFQYHQLTWYNSFWLWRWLPHRLSKRQSLSTTTVLFRTTFPGGDSAYERGGDARRLA